MTTPRPPQAPAPWRAGLVLLVLLAFVIACFASLDLQWRQFLSLQALADMARFLGEFVPPERQEAFLRKVAGAAAETLAMSALGTLLAVAGGLLLAVPAGRPAADADDAPGRSSHPATRAGLRAATRLLLNLLRSVPELVWATLLLVAVGLGPMAGVLALALHTSGVLGRLFAEAFENAAPEPALALRRHGAGRLQVLLYATLPQVLPQLLSYTLYRWENNIRAAAVLGVVGAGGLGQMLAFHMGLFQMGKTATVLIAMFLLVGLVDAISHLSRHWLMR